MNMKLAMSSDTVLQSQAFSLTFKALAGLLTVGCGVWLFSMAQAGLLGTGNTTTLGWFAAAVALMGWTLWHILRSKTSLSDQSLHQSWIWDKQIARSDIAYAKLIRVRGLTWLVAPRLYVRTLEGKFAVFYAAEAPMIAAFEQLEADTAKQLAGF